MRTCARIRTSLAGALSVLLGASLLSAVPAAAGAQADRPAGVPWDRAWEGTGPAVEALYTQVQTRGDLPGAPGGGQQRASGLGGRVMWPLGALPGAASNGSSWLARHASVGLFGAYTQEPSRTFTAAQFGVAADLAPLGAPLAGRVEPFVSLGAGALHTAQHLAAPTGPTVRPAERPVGRPADPPAGRLASVGAAAPVAPSRDRSATSLLLVPGVGARVRVRPGVAVQGDVRQLVTVRGNARRAHPAVSAGLRVAL